MKCLTLIGIAALAAFPQAAYCQERTQPPKPVAIIEALEGQTVTLRSYDGKRQVVSLKSIAGLKVGQHTSWCEEDCRELNVWMPLPVGGVKLLK
jgi:anti-sigma-K factor RskA